MILAGQEKSRSNSSFHLHHSVEMQKQKFQSQRPLSQLLHEPQEPFILEVFLSERQHLQKRAGGYAKKAGCLPNPKPDRLAGQRFKVGASQPQPHKHSVSSLSSPVRSPLKSPVNLKSSYSCIKTSPSRSTARLMEAAVRILEPGLHNSSRPRLRPRPSSTTVRYLVDLDHKANNRRSKRLRKASRKTQLDSAEEVYVQSQSQSQPHIGACSQSSRITSVERENSLNAWQRASEALISAFRLSSAKDKADSTHERGRSSAHYSKLFIFNKDNKGFRRTTEEQGQKNTKYNLLKSIVTRLVPVKESLKNASVKGNCNSMSDADGSGMQNIPEDTISMHNVGHSSNMFVGEREKFVSVERQRENFGGAIGNTCFSSMETQKSKVTSKGNVQDRQAFPIRKKDASWDLSFSSSSSAWLESSLDSDSLDVFSSTGRSSNTDSRELKGIYPGPDADAATGTSDESSSYDFFSFEIDENGEASDFHHAVNMPSAITPEHHAACYRHKGPADVKSSSTHIEEENECSSYMGNIVSETCIDDNPEEEVEQLSPVSVLDSPFEEGSPCFEQSLASIQRAKKQLLKKICEYEELAHMDPFVLEKKIASWKESSSEDENGSCRDEESEGMDDILVSCQTSSCSSYQEEEMEWEAVETEEYVRGVLSCSEANSDDLATSTSTWGCHYSSFVEDREMQTQGFVGGGSYLKAKQVSMRQPHCKLLFDSVNEELLSCGTSTSGYMIQPWLREQLVKRICGQVSAWEEVDTTTHTDKLVELDLKRKGEEWNTFREEQEEIGMKIEVEIFQVLVEEVLADLLQV